VDLCTGSAALALAIAAMRPDAEVHGVEVDPDALGWARRNVAAHGGRVQLHASDVRASDLLPDLVGRVDLVVCNPPYVPDATPVAPEVRTGDPAVAVFGGRDGLAVIPGDGAPAVRRGLRGGARRHARRGGARPSAGPSRPRGRRGARRPQRPSPLRHRPPPVAVAGPLPPSGESYLATVSRVFRRGESCDPPCRGLAECADRTSPQAAVPRPVVCAAWR
jgi:hypothetical protein